MKSKYKYKYRFKTEKEFINTFGEDWREVINGQWQGGYERKRLYQGYDGYGQGYGNPIYKIVPTCMNRFFGKKFTITKKERILKLEKGMKLRYYGLYWIYKDMLVCLFVPNYKPKNIIRKI